MEHRITSLLLPAPETELETSSKELDNKVTWLLHNNRKMDNYLELETFSKDERLCGYVCDTLRSLPETPTLAAYKDYKAIIVLLGISTTHYAILDELAEQHRKRNDIPELTAYCDALHWMRPGRQYLCNVYNTVCHAFHLLRRNPVRDNRLLITEQELRHAERMLPELGKQTFIEMVRMKGYKIYNAEELAEKCGMEYGSFRRKMKKVTGYTAKQIVETAGTKANTLNGFLETQKIFQQGKAYYDALKSVHDVVKGGIKVKKSIELVAEISEIYVRNYQIMLADPYFTADELATISSGYAMLLDESSDVLQDLKNVVNITGMSLTDAERLAIIDNAYRNLMNYRNLVNYYTRKNISVSYLRAKKKNDTDRVLALYGSADERYW